MKAAWGKPMSKYIFVGNQVWLVKYSVRYELLKTVLTFMSQNKTGFWYDFSFSDTTFLWENALNSKWLLCNEWQKLFAFRLFEDQPL